MGTHRGKMGRYDLEGGASSRSSGRKIIFNRRCSRMNYKLANSLLSAYIFIEVLAVLDMRVFLCKL